VRGTNDGDVQARLDALAKRVEASLVRVLERVEPPSLAPDGPQHDGLAAELRDAEARAQLQAQRCMALEDQVAALEAALTEARIARAEAEALAEATRREASLNQVGNSLDSQLAATLQAKLLEVERLSSELTELRRSNEDWRTRARNHRRELDSVTPKLEQANAQLSELRLRDESNSKRIAELERAITEQRRELEIAERRAKHMREHMVPR
jgi:chromosome segregation ATPase